MCKFISENRRKSEEPRCNIQIIFILYFSNKLKAIQSTFQFEWKTKTKTTTTQEICVFFLMLRTQTWGKKTPFRSSVAQRNTIYQDKNYLLVLFLLLNLLTLRNVLTNVSLFLFNGCFNLIKSAKYSRIKKNLMK